MNRPNEIAALADVIERRKNKRPRNEYAPLVHTHEVDTVISALRLSATSPGDAVRALQSIAALSVEKGHTIASAQQIANAALAPAEKAGDATFDKLFNYRSVFGATLREMILDYHEGNVSDGRAAKLTEEYIRSIYAKFAATPLQAPAHSDAVREANPWQPEETAPDDVTVWIWQAPDNNLHPAYGTIILAEKEDGGWFDYEGEETKTPEYWCPANKPKPPHVLEAALTAQAAHATPAPAEKAGDDDQFFNMLWDWFTERRGKEDMRACQIDGGLSADDFKEMLDEHEQALLDATPTPPSADVAKARVHADRIRWLLDNQPNALSFACEMHARARSIMESLDTLIQSAAPGGGHQSDGGDLSALPSGECEPVVTQAYPPSDPAQEPEAVAKPLDDATNYLAGRCFTIAGHHGFLDNNEAFAIAVALYRAGLLRPVSLYREALLDRVVEFDECETPEPTLRKMILGYYMQGLQPDAELARKFADRFILALIEGRT
jgi:hypothetical protein